MRGCAHTVDMERTTPRETHRSYSDLWTEFINTANAHPEQNFRLNEVTGTVTVIVATKAA